MNLKDLKYSKKSKPEHLKVVTGGKGSHKTGVSQKTVYTILFFLAFFLLAQILIGWVWGSFDHKTTQTVLAEPGCLDVSFSTSGIITFDEEIILAPRSGYIYYEIEEGERVPVGKKLAVITEIPLEEGDKSDNNKQEQGTAAYLQQALNWFLYGDRGCVETSSYVPLDERTSIYSPSPGLVTTGIDGWENYGPHSNFPYFTGEELENKEFHQQELRSGEMLNRFNPLLKIMDNYYWYYSTILPPEIGDFVAEMPWVKLYFSFAPDKFVIGETVEITKSDDHGGLEITWRINQAAEDYYNHRFSTAEVVYRELEGLLVPASALCEKNGKKGVYVIEKGVVNFREVNILGDENGFFLVENIEAYEQIIYNHSRVKEGQRFYW